MVVQCSRDMQPWRDSASTAYQLYSVHVQLHNVTVSIALSSSSYLPHLGGWSLFVWMWNKSTAVHRNCLSSIGCFFFFERATTKSKKRQKNISKHGVLCVCVCVQWTRWRLLHTMTLLLLLLVERHSDVPNYFRWIKIRSSRGRLRRDIRTRSQMWQSLMSARFL